MVMNTNIASLIRSLGVALGALVLCAACATADAPATSADAAPETYTQDSWKTMIHHTCIRYFDGCNRCVRAVGDDMAACTRMACETYQKPECLDEK